RVLADAHDEVAGADPVERLDGLLGEAGDAREAPRGPRLGEDPVDGLPLAVGHVRTVGVAVPGEPASTRRATTTVMSAVWVAPVRNARTSPRSPRAISFAGRVRRSRTYANRRSIP